MGERSGKDGVPPIAYGMCNFCILDITGICQKMWKTGPFETFCFLAFSYFSNWSVVSWRYTVLSFQDVTKSNPNSKEIIVIRTDSNKWKYGFLDRMGVKYWSGGYGPTGIEQDGERRLRNSDEGREGPAVTGAMLSSDWVSFAGCLSRDVRILPAGCWSCPGFSLVSEARFGWRQS